jgi:hypothetical protein
VKDQLRKTTPNANEDGAIHAPTFQEFNEENLSMIQQHAINQLSQMSKK